LTGWADTTPQPERPALSQAELPVGGSAIDRLLAAAAGLCLAALLIRAFA
jgi:hypothetical protein